MTEAYGYDGAGRMTSLRNGAIELQYDYDDRVLSMTSGGVYTAYLYNGLGTRVATTQGAMKWLRLDVAGVTSPLLSDGDYSYNQGISRTSGSTVTSTHSDMLGSIKLETSGSDSVTVSRDYDAFGNLTSGSNTGMLGFAGAWGYEEDPSGLELLGHRWYDSASGRFLTRDPAQDGRNWYSYCGNNPLTRVDPQGRKQDSVKAYIANLPRTYGNDPDVILSELQDVLEMTAKEASIHLLQAAIRHWQDVKRAQQLYRAIRRQNGAPLPGYKGGSAYRDDTHKLPRGGDYYEYDTSPKQPGVRRNSERLVIDRRTGRVWLTDDHYDSFTEITPNG